MQKWSDCSVSLESQSSLGSGMSMGNAEDLEYILVSTQYDDLKKASLKVLSTDSVVRREYSSLYDQCGSGQGGSGGTFPDRRCFPGIHDGQRNDGNDPEC